jgi:septum formation protein
MNLPPVILASASPRRRELLRELEIEFDILPSDVEESEGEQLTASEISQLNAYRKARAISKKCPDALVMGMDTVVALGARLFGKPADFDAAVRMLEELQGTTHVVVTGVCLVHLRTHRQKLFAERTEVTFRKLTRDEIKEYLRRIDPTDKAGGYAVQEHGDEVVRKISGSYSNVVGLPLERLRQELREFNLQPA